MLESDLTTSHYLKAFVVFDDSSYTIKYKSNDRIHILSYQHGMLVPLIFFIML
jgi:hypothetical protein